MGWPLLFPPLGGDPLAPGPFPRTVMALAPLYGFQWLRLRIILSGFWSNPPSTRSVGGPAYCDWNRGQVLYPMRGSFAPVLSMK